MKTDKSNLVVDKFLGYRKSIILNDLEFVTWSLVIWNQCRSTQNLRRGGRQYSLQLRTTAYTGRWPITPNVSVHSYFWQHAFLVVSCIICRNLILPSGQIRCVLQERLFFSSEISVCCHEINIFYIRLFFQNKVSENA